MIRRMNCPICEKELPPEMTGDSTEFPFCSTRCKQVDLHRWLNGEYACVESLDISQVEELKYEADLESEQES